MKLCVVILSDNSRGKEDNFISLFGHEMNSFSMYFLHSTGNAVRKEYG